jgi:hypothetical protein
MAQSLEFADQAASERPGGRLVGLSPEALLRPELIAILQRIVSVRPGSYDESALSSCAGHSLVARCRLKP